LLLELVQQLQQEGLAD